MKRAWKKYDKVMKILSWGDWVAAQQRGWSLKFSVKLTQVGSFCLLWRFVVMQEISRQSHSWVIWAPRWFRALPALISASCDWNSPPRVYRAAERAPTCGWGADRGVTGEGPSWRAVKVPDVTVTTSRNNLIPQLQPSPADLLLQGH